ncbi:putative phenol 2-monooxygenase [Stipitochalara longipes BDJ]|nr:putative phenol 2-monooxygenase [Stipitochalara longipes BDJ]
MDLTSGEIPVSMASTLPQNHVDVFICGSGSAGLCAATWLARYGLRCKIVDWRPGPLEVGQADGVQCRTVEVFDSFGIAEELLREAYHVLEVTFWADGGGGVGIVRSSRAPDREEGVSHMPHVILNQARVNGLLLGAMKRFNGQSVDYDYSVKSVEVDSEKVGDPDAYCVTVNTVRHGNEEVFKAKYVLACDGAHSAVRKSLGFKMIGDSTDSVWGVMDVYPRTNFPDIRRKAALQSQAGSLLIIPREGGSLARFYIELPSGTTAKDVKLEDLQASARKIFHPYELEIADTYWWSAYSIGQRLADHFSKDNRVFLTGDACHTHSPKAGQGMNVSLQDGYNIGWKLASILKGQARPDLLKTYNLEREKVAADLIEFDRGFAKAFASKSVKDGKQEKKFSELFVQAGRYTAGLMSKYGESPITRAEWSRQHLASNLVVGMRFPSTQVVRHCDAKAMQLVKALPADGRWRLVVFAGDIRQKSANERLKKLASYLSTAKSPVSKYTPAGADIDSFIEPILVLSGNRIQIEQDQIPDYFWPITGKYRMRDIHKTFVDDESYNSGHGKAYEFYGVDREVGAVAIVRPDQYVSLVVGIDDFEVIGKFFDGFAVGRPRSDQFDLEDIVKKGLKDLNGLMRESI